MKSRHPLTLDLNNLFKPFISDGLQNLTQLENDFNKVHGGIAALKKTGHMPYAHLPQDDLMRDNVLQLAKEHKGYDNIVVLGIGGSALGTISLYHALRGPFANDLAKQKGTPRLFVIDNIEAQTLQDLHTLRAKDNNLFIVISKSGNTSETLAQYLFVKTHFTEATPKDFIFITDPQNGYLHDLVVKDGLKSLPVPTGVGGRFSVFTPVGLLPLALCGVDISNLLDGAQHAEEACLKNMLAQNPAGLIATTLHHWLQQGQISQVVLMPYSDRLKLVSDWFAQLWGESLGKKQTLDGQIKHIGSTPIKSCGVTDQHSQLQLYLEGPRDKVVLFLEIEEPESLGHLGDHKANDERIDFLSDQNLNQLMAAEKSATEESLRSNDRPNATLKLSKINAFQMGQTYQLMMNVIPYMGALLNINPFDQPAVEQIKQYTFGLMGRPGFEDYQEKLKIQPKNKELIF